MIDDSPIDKEKLLDVDYVDTLYASAKTDEEIFKIQELVKDAHSNKV